MSKVYLEDTTLTAIGDSIRQKSGKKDLILPKDMPNEIASLPSERIDVEINDASYFFYQDARIDQKEALIPLLKNLKTTANMFRYSQQIRNFNYENYPIDMSNVTDMNGMFASSSLESFDSSQYDTTNVQNMSELFNGCQYLSNINLSNFKTHNVTRMDSMFSNINYIANYDLSSFDTSNVTDMSNMFSINTNSLIELDLSNFKTHNVENMSYMFYTCSRLEKLNISGFTSEKLNNTYGMFANCSNLKTLIINSPSLFNIADTDLFNSTPIESGTGYVYVPDELVEEYKSATNWSNFADQIKGISELQNGM